MIIVINLSISPFLLYVYLAYNDVSFFKKLLSDASFSLEIHFSAFTTLWDEITLKINMI